MKRNFLILLCLFSLICPNLQAIHSPDDEAVERGEILRTLNYYFESENIGAPVELRKAYHPKATFMSVSNKISATFVETFNENVTWISNAEL